MIFIEKKDVCLHDSATTHTIFSGKYYFSSLTLCKANVHTIYVPVEIINGFENATILLSKGTTLHIKDALLSTKSKRNLLSFNDVRYNRYQFETINENDIDCLCITFYKMRIKAIHESLKFQIKDCIVSL